jgi:hypothetical protein
MLGGGAAQGAGGRTDCSHIGREPATGTGMRLAWRSGSCSALGPWEAESEGEGEGKESEPADEMPPPAVRTAAAVAAATSAATAAAAVALAPPV